MDEKEKQAEAEAEMRKEVQAEIFDGAPSKYNGEEVYPQKQEADPLADVNPALLETIKKISGELESIKGFGDRLKQTENRIGALSNKAQEEKKALENAPTEEELAKKADIEETWEAVEIEFPDIAKGVSGKLTENKTVIESLRKEVDEIKSGGSTKDAKKAETALEIKFVSVVHPDWKEVVDSGDYKEWLAMQPTEYQTKARTSKKAEEAVSVLNDFKKTVSGQVSETIEQLRNKRLASSVSTPGTNRKQFKQKSESEMSEAELRESVRQEVFG